MGITLHARDSALLLPRRYTMTTEESSRWDSGDGCDRREMLYSFGERLLAETGVGDDCCVAFYHADGQLVGKTVYRRSLLRRSA